jgi:hypothetical protein
MLKTAAVAALCGLLVLACGGGGDPAPTSAPAEGFSIQQHDAQSITATLTSGGATVHFAAVQSSARAIDLTYDFGAPVVAFHVDFAEGKGEFMPAGGTLDAAQSRLMDLLLAHFNQELPAQDSARTLVESTAIRQTMLMQIVPIGEALEAFGFVSERGWTYIHCGCSNQWDGHDGYHVGGVGCGCTGGSGNGCKGRCGAGCQQDGASINAYTQDCLCHDYGKCSWTTASDDFLFAASNCGESYGCY